MGLLSLGKPLTWNEAKKYAEFVQNQGILQFIEIYRNAKDRQAECLRWGDEIEYMIVKFDNEKEKVKLALRAKELLEILNEDRNASESESLWMPEFGGYMIEGTPRLPYETSNNHSAILSHLNCVEENMKQRRLEVQRLLENDEAMLCLTSFPRAGCSDFCYPSLKLDPINSATNSIFFPDDAIYTGHPRFITSMRNTRSRRGRKININIPIFKDENTKTPFREYFGDEESDDCSKTDHIYMDSELFGMGCCCLQVTFQASNIDEARILYDQLTPLCPILMALTAASPIHRGYMSDIDCRWSVVSQSCDDRTKEECGEEPLKNCKYRITKPRFDSTDCYISENGAKYNDIELVYDKQHYEQLIEAGIDSLLAKHIAHLFIRDPIILFEEQVKQKDENKMDHFENIQSTNWQSMRFKPPPLNSSIGWRVEFRPMDVQFTDFENAAFVVFIVLLTRVILTYDLNFLIPISKVNENMQKAQKRDAISRCKFWFRKDIITEANYDEIAYIDDTESPLESDEESVDGEDCVLMSINEIINGNGTNFPGLVPLLRQYLLSADIDAETHCTVQQYLSLISSRASGEILTDAAWIRKFVATHEDYKKDSVVTDKINFDLIKMIDSITKGEIICSELLGNNPCTMMRLLRVINCTSLSSSVVR